jgi:uncharacterized membrane protein (DUF106 family)
MDLMTVLRFNVKVKNVERQNVKGKNVERQKLKTKMSKSKMSKGKMYPIATKCVFIILLYRNI